MLKLLQRKLLKMFTVVALLLSVNAMWGQQSITALNTATSQNFNSIGASSTATLPAGFRVSSSNPGSWSSGTATATTQAAGSSGTNAITGSSTYGIYNYADGVTASSTDRAIGFLTSSNAASYSPWSIIYAFTNNTGSTVTSLEISFDYEKYRTGTRAWDWTFFHGNTATVATSATDGDQSYAEDSALGAVSPVTTISKSFTLSGLSIATGTTYYLKWVSTGNGGKTNSQGIGLDNFSIKLLPTSVPTYTLVYDANTGTGTAPTGGSYQAAASFTTATQGGLTKSGYNFTGWNTAADGSGTGYAANTAYTMPAANLTLYAQWALNTTPTITTSGSLLGLTTTYGTASANTYFYVSGSNLTSGIVINAPAGFEIATETSTDYASSITLPQLNGSVSSTLIDVRLAKTTLYGTYSGNVTLISTGATNVNIATASSTVNKKTLIINNLTGINKTYDGNLTASASGNGTISGTVNNDVISLEGSPIFAFTTKIVGTNKLITTTGYTISGTNANSYTLTQPSLSANINAKSVTLTSGTVAPKTYDGTTAATINNVVLDGKVVNDDLSVTGVFLQSDAGNNLTVTISLSGTDKDNYTLLQASLIGNITKATPAYTTTPISVSIGGTYTLPSNNITSTSNVTPTYSLNGSAASLTGNTLSGVSVGTAILTVRQIEGTNYLEGSTTVNVSVTSEADGTYRTLTDGKWPGTGNGFATWERLTSGVWTTTTSSGAAVTPSASAADVIIIRNAITTGGNYTSSSPLGRSFVIENGGSFTSLHNGTAKSILIKNGGTLTVTDNTLAVLSSTTSNLIVEDGGKLIINRSTMTSNDNFWNGTENFKDGSIVEIQNWNANANAQGDRFVQNPSTISANSSGYIFGNLTLSGSSTGNFKIVDGTQTVKLTSGNLTIARSGSLATNLTNNNSRVTINGDIIITSGTLNVGSNVSPVVTVEGNVNVSGGTLNINSASSPTGSVFSTLEIKGGLYTAAGSTLTSTDDDSKIAFTGTVEQTIQLSGTLNTRADFEIASGANVKLLQNLALPDATNSFTALSGGMLNTQTYAITGSGIFISNDGSTIATSNTGGIGSTITTVTKTFGAGTNYTFNGATTTAFPTSGFDNNPGNITTNANVTLNRNITSQGNTVVNTGTFDLGSYTINRAATGGSLSIATGATLKIGGTNGFPANYNTLNFSPNSTVEYGGQAQQVGNLSAEYKNVVLSGTGAKSFVNGTIVGNNLILQSGPTVTIPSNTTITVGNSLINNATAESFVINNNGALLQTGTGANTGAITVLKNANPLYRLDYTMWAAPVENQKLIDFSSATASNRFYEYKYATNAQNQNVEGYWSVDASNVFSAAKGYLIRMPNTDDTAGYNGGAATLTFEGKFVGKPHTGDYNITASTAANRFTAVGNPYPSPIGVEEFYAQNSDVLDNGATIFLWRKRNSTTQASSYAKLTRTMFTANGSSADVNGNHTGGQDQGTYFSSGRTFMLAAGQGFIVKTKNGATATDIKFTNSMRKAAPADGQAFLRTAQTPASRLWINIAGPDGGFSQSGLAYLANATTGIDYGYDGKQLIEQGIVSLYSVAEGTALVIQARPEFTTSDVVPMGYNANVAGNFTISIDHTDGLFAAGQNVYLKDKAMGITRNISETDYTFTTEAGTFEDRFELVYTTEALGTDNPVLTADNLIVYKNGESININAGSTRINAVTVFDIRGRKLYSQQNVNNTEEVVSGLTVQSQVLIVEIATEKGIVSKKIIF